LTASSSTWPPGWCSACSAPTARARRPSCASSRRCWRRGLGRPACTLTTGLGLTEDIKYLAINALTPVTLTVDAARALTIGHGHALGPALGMLAWLAGLLLVFVPLSVRAFRRAQGASSAG
jgi:hypothetical protein